MAYAMNERVLLVSAILCGALGCGGKSGVVRGGGGGTAGTVAGGSGGGTTGNATDGGAGTGGMGLGGAGTGGAATGGARGADAAVFGGSGGGLATRGAAGAVATGGTGVAGTGAGGARTGGAATGGSGTGGARTGGTGAGGSGTGGTRTGGTGAGGSGTGGTRTGGTGAGGSGTGGTRTGGAGGTTGAGTGGTPAEAFLDLDHTKMDFGSIAPGTTKTEAFTLTNRGATTSGVPFVTTEGTVYPLGNPNPVTVTGCSAALPPNASCTLTISVTPTKLGLLQATVRITANPGTQEHSSSSLSIYVVGSGIGFEISSPSTIDLGELAPGVTVKQSITVTALIALSDLTVRTSGEDITIDAAATTCTAVLAQGASCVVTVAFNAATVGWKRDMVGIKAGGDMGQSAGTALTANVTKSSDLGIEPKTPPAYTCVIEQTSPPVVFTVTNLGDTPSGTIASTIVGDDPRDFAVGDSDCTTLAPQATCTISVVCSPPMSATTATRHAILSVTDGNTHLSIPLSAEVTYDW